MAHIRVDAAVPPLDQLPPDVADICAPAAEAVDRWRELQQRHRDAKVKAAAEEQRMRDAYAAAARDPQVKVPADRRPALAEEVRVAAELERRAKVEAGGAWYRMSARLRGLDPGQYAPDDEAIEAAATYQAAIDALEAARRQFHERMAVHKWMRASLGVPTRQRPDATAPSFHPRVPHAITPPGRGVGHTPVDVAPMLTLLRADATAGTDQAAEAKRQAYIRRNPQAVAQVQQRAAKAEADEHANT